MRHSAVEEPHAGHGDREGSSLDDTDLEDGQATIQGSDAAQVSLRRRSPEERAAYRRRMNFVVISCAAVVLGWALFLLLRF